jgi:hypothetical protein
MGPLMLDIAIRVQRRLKDFVAGTFLNKATSETWTPLNARYHAANAIRYRWLSPMDLVAGAGEYRATLERSSLLPI